MHAVNINVERVEVQEELARLTAGILHELNTPLGALRSATDTLGRMFDAKDTEVTTARAASAQKLTGVVEQSVDRITQVIRGLERLAEVDAPVEERVDVRDAITAAFVAAENADDVEFHAPDEPLVIAASNRLVRGAVAAVIHNARQATSRGGDVRVHAFRTGGSVVVSVEDSGCGMSEQELTNIFSIGFTEREGRIRLKTSLAWARRTIEAMNGEIEIQSVEGKGTRVEMRWPSATP